jgi:hypothetical protein
VLPKIRVLPYEKKLDSMPLHNGSNFLPLQFATVTKIKTVLSKQDFPRALSALHNLCTAAASLLCRGLR